MSIPRCGDHVRHIPSSEPWVVAYAENDDLVPAGWPACIAKLSDCEMEYRCSDGEHRRWVKGWAVSTPDWRQKRVMSLYGLVLEDAKP